jgi:hypothetical protein
VVYVITSRARLKIWTLHASWHVIIAFEASLPFAMIGISTHAFVSWRSYVKVSLFWASRAYAVAFTQLASHYLAQIAWILKLCVILLTNAFALISIIEPVFFWIALYTCLIVFAGNAVSFCITKFASSLIVIKHVLFTLTGILLA